MQSSAVPFIERGECSRSLHSLLLHAVRIVQALAVDNVGIKSPEKSEKLPSAVYRASDRYCKLIDYR